MQMQVHGRLPGWVVTGSELRFIWGAPEPAAPHPTAPRQESAPHALGRPSPSEASLLNVRVMAELGRPFKSLNEPHLLKVDFDQLELLLPPS